MVKKKMRIIIVYDTKHGNTKLVAEKIVEGIDEIGGIETTVIDVEEADLEKVASYDAVLIGSPNHMGGPVRGIKKLIDKLGKVDLATTSSSFKINCNSIPLPNNPTPTLDVVRVILALAV